MAKKCIICEQEAAFSVKGSSETYCPTCAEEHFGDLALLVGIEEQAKQIKGMVNTVQGEEE